MAFYDIVDTIKTHLLSNEVTNTVTEGDIFEVDLNKKTIFPLAHIIVDNAVMAEHITTFNITILFMDVVDISKDDPANSTSPFLEISNRQDVLNTQLYVANRLTETLRRGDLFQDKYQLATTPTAQPFDDRFENLLAGWNLSLSIEIPNEIYVCP